MAISLATPESGDTTIHGIQERRIPAVKRIGALPVESDELSDVSGTACNPQEECKSPSRGAC